MGNDALIKFIRNSYRTIDTEEQADLILSGFRDNIIVYYEKSSPVFFAIYLLINDSELFNLVTRPEDILNVPENLRGLIGNDGDHIHFILAAGKAIPYGIRAVKHVRKTFNPKTVSWYRDNMRFCVIKERKSECHNL